MANIEAKLDADVVTEKLAKALREALLPQETRVNTINILGIPYQIKEVPVIDKDEFTLGRIDFIKQVILLDQELSAERKGQTLLHEILHGICEQLGFSEINENEQIIQGLAVALYQVLQQPYIRQPVFARREKGEGFSSAGI